MTLKPSARSIEALIGYETGGRTYYEARLCRPSWPGGLSGVTVGVGYDLGYHTPAEVMAAWAAVLGDGPAAYLASVAGRKGTQAQQAWRAGLVLRDIFIPWEAALQVFRTVTLPVWLERTAKAFPGAGRLHPDVQGVLVSLAYNRGTGMTGDSRREMREMRGAVAKGDTAEIARQIRQMKRLWVGQGLDGLIRRREAEAGMVETAGAGEGT